MEIDCCLVGFLGAIWRINACAAQTSHAPNACTIFYQLKFAKK